MSKICVIVAGSTSTASGTYTATSPPARVDWHSEFDLGDSKLSVSADEAASMGFGEMRFPLPKGASTLQQERSGRKRYP